MRYAVDRGAREVLLMGWSMGGAIVLQLLDRSPLSALVSRVVLDAPVIDWGDVLAHHAQGAPGAPARRLAGPGHDAAAVGPPARRGARGRRPGQDRLGARGAPSCTTRCCSSTAPTTSSCPAGPSRELAAGPARPGAPSRSGTWPGTARSGTPTPSAGSASSATSPPADAAAVRGGGPASRPISVPASSTSSRGTSGMPSGPPSGRAAGDPGAVATDDRAARATAPARRRRPAARAAASSVGPPSQSTCRRPRAGQGVERGGQVDGVVAGDEHGILTERLAGRGERARRRRAAQVTSSPAPRPSTGAGAGPRAPAPTR